MEEPGSERSEVDMRFPDPQQYKSIGGVMYHQSEWFTTKTEAFAFMKQEKGREKYLKNRKVLVKMEIVRKPGHTPAAYIVYVRWVHIGKAK
jgi:hypothetical protein